MAHVERIAISLSKDLARRVEAERKQTGETRSAFVRRAIEQRLREKARAAKVSAYTEGYRKLKLLRRNEEPQFVGIFYNRAFINVDATRLIADRTFGSGGDAVEHRVLGGEYRDQPRRSYSWELTKFRLASALPLTRLALGIFRAADRAERETLAREEESRRIDLSRLTGPELEAFRQELRIWASGIFTTHLQASGCAVAGFDMVGRAVRPVLKDETEGQLPVLFTGMRDVESARIALDLWELSRIALREGLAPALRDGTFDPAGLGAPAAWRDAFDRFMDRHGHRGLNEMEPSARAWRADPAPVLQVVVSYLDMPDERSPLATLERQEQARLRLTGEIRARMNPVRRPLFGWTLRQGQRWVALRERTKSICVRAMRIADYYVPDCQRRLLEAGAIEQPDDLFFISNGELREFLMGRAVGDFKAAVVRRRREIERNRHVVLPERFSGRPSPLEPDLAHHSGEVLTGTPVSPGSVTGRARVILDPVTDGPLLPGEVLVAPVTDAGWTPLFALASGLVVDMGSALSHGSTVAREYGLPAVVNVRNGTRAIRTGDLLLVNGTAGTVAVLAEAGHPSGPAVT